MLELKNISFSVTTPEGRNDIIKDISLTVEDGNDAVAAIHRLLSGGKVDHGKSAVSECDINVNKIAVFVRTAMCLGSSHCPDNPVGIGNRVMIEYSAYCTHSETDPFLTGRDSIPVHSLIYLFLVYFQLFTACNQKKNAVYSPDKTKVKGNRRI